MPYYFRTNLMLSKQMLFSRYGQKNWIKLHNKVSWMRIWEKRDHADWFVSIFLWMFKLRKDPKTKTGRLLCLLFIWKYEMSFRSGDRDLRLLKKGTKHYYLNKISYARINPCLRTYRLCLCWCYWSSEPIKASGKKCSCGDCETK